MSAKSGDGDPRDSSSSPTAHARSRRRALALLVVGLAVLVASCAVLQFIPDKVEPNSGAPPEEYRRPDPPSEADRRSLSAVAVFLAFYGAILTIPAAHLAWKARKPRSVLTRLGAMAFPLALVVILVVVVTVWWKSIYFFI